MTALMMSEEKFKNKDLLKNNTKKKFVLVIFTLGSELLEGDLGERGSDLETLGHDRRGDQLVAGHLLQELVIGSLVEEDQVVQLVTGLSFRPLLLIAKRKEKKKQSINTRRSEKD
jgi:hypothetical protein